LCCLYTTIYLYIIYSWAHLTSHSSHIVPFYFEFSRLYACTLHTMSAERRRHVCLYMFVCLFSEIEEKNYLLQCTVKSFHQINNSSLAMRLVSMHYEPTDRCSMWKTHKYVDVKSLCVCFSQPQPWLGHKFVKKMMRGRGEMFNFRFLQLFRKFSWCSVTFRNVFLPFFNDSYFSVYVFYEIATVTRKK
jgi:hypothetical protein